MKIRPLEKRPIIYQEATILGSIRISDKIKVLRLQPEQPFDWIPGQFIITKNIINTEQKIADYTIISSNKDNTAFEIAVENYPGSKVGKFLHSLKPTNKFVFKAPRGRFYFEDNHNNLVFVFRNIGIVAAIPLLQYLTEIKYDYQINIFNVISDGFDEIFQDKIREFSKRIKINYSIIDSSIIEKERFVNGKFLKKEMTKLFSQLIVSDFYLSGSSEFLKSFRQKITQIGVDKDKIVREMFG